MRLNGTILGLARVEDYNFDLSFSADLNDCWKQSKINIFVNLHAVKALRKDASLAPLKSFGKFFYPLKLLCNCYRQEHWFRIVLFVISCILPLISFMLLQVLYCVNFNFGLILSEKKHISLKITNINSRLVLRPELMQQSSSFEQQEHHMKGKKSRFDQKLHLVVNLHAKLTAQNVKLTTSLELLLPALTTLPLYEFIRSYTSENKINRNRNRKYCKVKANEVHAVKVQLNFVNLEIKEGILYSFA